jgi:hypothetical protein
MIKKDGFFTMVNDGYQIKASANRIISEPGKMNISNLEKRWER